MASGSARVAVLAIRSRLYRLSSQASPEQALSADADPVQTEKRTSTSSKFDGWSRATSAYDSAECLLDAFSFGRDSDSESSDDDSSAGNGAAPPKRTATSLCMQDTDEFVDFVDRHVKRERQLRKDAYISREDSFRRTIEANPGNGADDMLCLSHCPKLDEGSESDSDADLDVCRSPRLDDIPAASEYLAPLALQEALKTLYKAREIPLTEQQGKQMS
eukprot:TRINITY_DN54181_c0_g1_i1.p1 TRINITY_DN54181_c0_g1~~TRINITY_DN54181_c0_g1_i1.p1  ORF type:complete len:218 (-),score=38.56 TRINITY_DN54181_c0_g1_i1:609-1262(-)